MIEQLRLESLGLVETAQLEFAPGLNVITGETGAGKSMVLGALALLVGGRASSELVREGAEEAIVEALFDTRALPALEAALAERGLAGDEHTLIVRRSVARSGKSRAWVGGQLVPVAALAELFAPLVEISSQHAFQSLLRPEAQGLLLDAYGGLRELRHEVERGVRELREREAETARLRAASDERARREDYLAFQLREIDEARVDPQDLAACERERSRLAHALRLQTDAARAATALAGDPASSDAAGAIDRVAEAARSVAELVELDAGLREAADRLASLRVELADVARDLERYAAGVDPDPERLAALDERLRAFERVRRKYGPTAEDVLAQRARAAAELADVTHGDERLRALEADRQRAHEAVAQLAERLSAERASAAAQLARSAAELIRGLALERARFEVALEPVAADAGMPCAASGAEAAELRFSANPGEPLRALRKVASGGELSRIFLALKSVLRRAGAGMVLVFDEVDAAIGGAVADRVGARLADLAAQHQVLCITHLPQIAVQGGRHFVVSKATAAGRTVARVAVLGARERVDEIARMAGGEVVTEATRRHARALLESARDKATSRTPAPSEAEPRVRNVRGRTPPASPNAAS